MKKITKKDYTRKTEAKLPLLHNKVILIKDDLTTSAAEANALKAQVQELIGYYSVKKLTTIDHYAQKLQKKLDEIDANIDILQGLKVLLTETGSS